MHIEQNHETALRFKSLLNYWKQLTEDGITPLIEKQLLLMLDSSLPFFTHLVQEKRFPLLKRVTNNRSLTANERIACISLLSYPPAGKITAYGRCNMPKQSVFYGTFDPLTLLDETRPRIGDRITISTWRQKTSARIKCCPIFLNQPTHADVINERTLAIANEYDRVIQGLPENLQSVVQDLHQFIADAFSKRVNPSNHLDYIFSAYFSSKILYELDSGTIEAIYYPSVKARLSFENLAIKPSSFDSHFELIEVEEHIVRQIPSPTSGGYFLDETATCKKFDYASGLILWGS